MFRPGKNKVILGFQIMRDKSPYSDMFVVTTSGIDFCKITSDKPLKISMIKSYSLAISDFWFNSNDGTILVHNSHTLDLTPFFMYQSRGAKHFQGILFSLSQKYIENGISASLQCSNLSSLLITALDKIQLILTRIYDCTYLLNLDGLSGAIYLYKIEQEQQSQLKMTIQLKPGGYALRVLDNLIIVHNYGPQESYIFDILKDIEPNRCLFMIKHRGSVDLECKFHQISFPSEIDPHYVVFSNELYLDVIDWKLLELKLYPLMLVENYPDPLDAILFLLRRDRCLADALNLIKKCLVDKIEIHKLTHFFNITNYAYKETAMLRKGKKKDESRESVNRSEKKQEENKENPSRVDTQLKSKSGMSILLQSDMYVSVFKPFYKENKDYVYLQHVILSYIYSLVSQDLHVHVSHQYLLVKTLLKLGNFKLIQYLIQYQMLANHLEMAFLLTSLVEGQEKYPELFNLGIDMLCRLKQYSTAVQILAEKRDFFEALTIIMVYEDKYDLQHLRSLAINTEFQTIVDDAIEEYETKPKIQ